MRLVELPNGGYGTVDSVEDVKYYIREYMSDEFADIVESEYEIVADDIVGEKEKILEEEKEIEIDGYLEQLRDIHDEIERIVNYLGKIGSNRLGPVKFNKLYTRLNDLRDSILSTL